MTQAVLLQRVFEVSKKTASNLVGHEIKDVTFVKFLLQKKLLFIYNQQPKRSPMCVYDLKIGSSNPCVDCESLRVNTSPSLRPKSCTGPSGAVQWKSVVLQSNSVHAPQLK